MVVILTLVNILKIRFIKDFSVKPDDINVLLRNKNTSEINQSVKLYNLLLRPQIKICDLINYIGQIKEIVDNIEVSREDIIELSEIEIKYDGYIKREKEQAGKIKRLENIKISQNIDYSKLKSISTEGRQKLARIKPRTIGQALRISGVSPADINVLLVHLGR